MDEDFEFFYLNPTPTHIRGYMTAVRNKAREEGRRSALEEAIKLSDKIEMSEPDGGTKEWMAFKHFRNTLRDSLTK